MGNGTLVLFIHADPGIRHLYQGDYHLVFINKGALSSSYTRYANRLQQGKANMLEALCQDAAGVHPSQYDHVVMASFSAGYGLAREVLEDPRSVRQLDCYVSIDSFHAPMEADGTAMDSRLGGLVRFALMAKEGSKVCYIGHTDVPTYGYASTTQVAQEVKRLVGGVDGHFVVDAYDEKSDHKSEHSHALVGWGPGFLKRAIGRIATRELEDEGEEIVSIGLGRLALAVARREMSNGVAEYPGKEHNPRILEYMKCGVRNGSPLVLTADEYPWCAYFASWCMLQPIGDKRLRLPHRPRAAVVELWRDGLEFGTAVGISNVRERRDLVRPGDLLIMTRGGPAFGEGKDAFAKSKGKGHVGRVDSVVGDTIATIDGNVGDTIKRMQRSIYDPTMVGVISYDGLAVTPGDEELEGFRMLMAERMVSAFEDLPGKSIQEVVEGVDATVW